jgi:hypothetical protein
VNLPRPRRIESPVVGTIAPRWEAIALFRLVKARCFSPDQIRRMIHVSAVERESIRRTFGPMASSRAVAYRRLVLLHFNRLAMRRKT